MNMPTANSRGQSPAAPQAGPTPQTDRQRELLAVVGLLSEQIGPRPPAGEGERLAAAFMIDRLRRAGYAVTLEPFIGLRTASWTYTLLYGAGALAAVLGRRLPHVGALLGLGAASAFVAEILGYEAAGRLPGLPRGRSANVLARGPRPAAAAPPTRRIVLVAHLDSSRAALPFHPRLLGRFRESFVAAMTALGVIGLGGVLRLAAPLRSRRRRAIDALSLVAGGYLLGPLATLLHREAQMPVVAGANDNGSGAAVVLVAAEQLAPRLRDQPASDAELWVLFTGCGESGQIGMQRFLAAHGGELDRASTLFLNIDSVGGGLLTIVNQEGLLWPWLADHELVDVATRVALRRGLHFQTRGFHTLATEAQVPLARGYRALTLIALDEQGHVPNWHWPTDTWSRVDPRVLESALELVVRIVRRLGVRPGGG